MRLRLVVSARRGVLGNRRLWAIWWPPRLPAKKAGAEDRALGLLACHREPLLPNASTSTFSFPSPCQGGGARGGGLSFPSPAGRGASEGTVGAGLLAKPTAKIETRHGVSPFGATDLYMV